MFLSYRNQSIDLLRKLIGWFLCGGNIGCKWGNPLSFFFLCCYEREVNVAEADILKLNDENLTAFN